MSLLENAILSSKPDPFDPMELALQSAGDRLFMQTEHLHPEWSLFSRVLASHRSCWLSPRRGNSASGDEVVVASKGAPEAVAELCRLSPESARPWRAGLAALAAEGLRCSE